MTDVLDRPELALAALLVLALCWAGLAFWLRLRPVGDDVGERLDALQPTYEMAALAVPAEPPDPLPMPLPRLSIYAQLCATLGYDPLGEPS